MENNLKCSIIISVYKDTDSLDLILESLINQTIIPNEVIISEDGNSKEMVEYVKVAKDKYKKLDIVHLYQEDIGWRKNIRDWLYVLDHCKGIDLVYHNGKTGEVYNIGGRNERTNLQIVDRITTILDEQVPLPNFSYKSLITFVEDRAGHDRRYAIDATKLENELGWKADENFDTGIVKTIEWYLKKYGINK